MDGLLPIICGYLTFLLFYCGHSSSTETYLIVSTLPNKTHGSSIIFYPNYTDTLSTGRGRQTVISPKNVFFPTRMAALPVQNSLFVYDYYRGAIHRAVGIREFSFTWTLNYGDISSSSASSIAVDWVYNNVYWTDGVFRWIAVRPLETKDETMYSIIQQYSMYQPQSLTVDSLNGYVFWFDTYVDSPRIETSTLSGVDRRVIISTGLKSVNDMAIDAINKKLLWVDELRFSVEESSYDGTNRRIIYKETNVPFSTLTVSAEHVCFGYFTGIACAQKTHGTLTFVDKYTQPVSSIDIYDERNQPSDTNTTCLLGCEHICVGDTDGPKCLCKEGYSLQSDGLSCKKKPVLEEGRAIVTVNNTHACLVNIRALTGSPETPDCFIDDLYNAAYIAADAIYYIVYYGETNQIIAYNLETDEKEVLTTTNKMSGLAFDWLSKLLYWSESDTGNVKYVNVTDKSVHTLYTAQEPVYDVTVDPYDRIVFWISGVPNFPNSIDMIHNGGARRTIVGNMKSLTGLYYDTWSDRIYWMNEATLYSCLRNGTGVTKHIDRRMGNSVHTNLIIYKGYMIWSNDKGPVQITAFSPFRPLSLGSVTGLSVMDAGLQLSQRGPCEINNGDCEQICIPQDTTSRMCKCDVGYTLNSNGMDCDMEIITNNFLLTQDSIHGRIYQMSLDSLNIVSLDIPGVQKPGDVIYDEQSRLVYWTEVDRREIMVSTLYGNNVTSIIKLDSSYPERIVLDRTTQLIFYTSSSLMSNKNGTIGVLEPKRGANRTLVSQEGVYQFVSGLVLHSEKGLMFWTSWADDGNALIARAWMDGSDVKVIVASGLHYPRGLTIDFKNLRLYWTTHSGIYSSNFDGSFKKTFTTETTELSDLVIRHPYIYYVGRRDTQITKATLSPFKRYGWMAARPELGTMLTLDLYPGTVQAKNRACGSNNGGCSMFCLPASSGRTCACGQGVALLTDNRTCEGVTFCEKQIPHGALYSSCLAREGSTCQFSCDLGFTVSFSLSTCDSTGHWDHPVSQWCKKEPEIRDTFDYAVVGGAVAGGTAAVVVIIILACILRRKVSHKDKKRSSLPKVYYSPPSDQGVVSTNIRPISSTDSHGYQQGPVVFEPTEQNIYDEIEDPCNKYDHPWDQCHVPPDSSYSGPYAVASVLPDQENGFIPEVTNSRNNLNQDNVYMPDIENSKDTFRSECDDEGRNYVSDLTESDVTRMSYVSDESKNYQGTEESEEEQLNTSVYV